MDTKQENRWNDQELALIKSVFKDKEFIYALRDVLMGFSDKFEHQTTEEVLAIVKKNILPQNSPDVPLMKQQDLCELSLDYINGFNAEQGILRIKAFDIAQDYLYRRLGVLEGKEDSGLQLRELRCTDYAVTDEDRFVKMLAYLQLGKYIEKSLSELTMIASYVELTPEEREKRQQMNSSK